MLDQGGQPGVDHLFAYEDQSVLLAFLEGRLGLRIRLAQRNVSPDMRLDLSQKVREGLREKCPQEFEVWEMARS